MKPLFPTQDELKQLGIQLPPKGSMPFSEPLGHFEDFEAKLLMEIRQDEFLSSLPKKNPFSTPTNYFQDFENSLNTQFFLKKMPSNVPYEVPSNYFEHLETDLKKRIQVANRVEIRPFRRVYANLAIAATLFLFITIGFGILNSSSNSSSIAQQLNKLPDSEIERYMQAHQDEFLSDVESFNNESNIDFKKLEQDLIDKQFENISAEELSNYL
jgi:hypothetical protein